MRSRQADVAAAVLLLLVACSSGWATSDAGGGEGQPAETAADLFNRAVTLRNASAAASPAQQQQRAAGAAELLALAAGVSLGGSANGSLQAVDVGELGSGAHPGAARELAHMYRDGEGVDRDFAVAYQLFAHAAQLGDAAAQSEMGLYHAWGITPDAAQQAAQPELPFRFRQPDMPLALLNYYFAAAGNDSVAQATLGYRHLHGLGVPQSCQAAVLYYAPVAERVAALSTDPDVLPTVDRHRLTHRSVHRPGVLSREHEALHYQWWADMGNADAQFRVGQLLATGAQRDLPAAATYFRRAAESGNVDALAALGHAYARGGGVPQNNRTALKLLTRAAEARHPSGHYGLGYMHLMGHGVPVDYAKALRHLTLAVERGAFWGGAADAWYYLGMMHHRGLGTARSSQQATYYLSQAAKAKHVLAQYNLAMAHLAASSTGSSCNTAAGLLKAVAERGPWTRVLQDSYEAFVGGEYERALLGYLRAAEMGVEVAQVNAAWMLQHGYGYEGEEAAAVAVVLHRAAAGQGVVDSLLALGDSYYYGRGLPQDWSKAAEMYLEASQASAQALFNLGYMHQYGAGLHQDFHLAKRYYDQALQREPKALLPIKLALAALALHKRALALAPHLPAGAGAALRGVFAVHPRGPAPAPPPGSHGGEPAWVGGWLDAAVEGEWLEQLAGGLGERAETALLLAALAGLALVLRRRHRLRMAQHAGRQAAGRPATAGRAAGRVDGALNVVPPGVELPAAPAPVAAGAVQPAAPAPERPADVQGAGAAGGGGGGGPGAAAAPAASAGSA